ncbi:hypothetical protein [Maricaulis alexandrii]|uniref:hypothetical protein n=1 Tax=Maricaulis alexandrii TaxID=2570354 RepID=UPI001107CA6D|nr:hypothetical protein [Maricaulis alexandrii]
MDAFKKNSLHQSKGPIACLGWGSLVWDSRTLPLAGEWKTDGPALPLEFARQSGNGRMTLVIVDSGHGVPVLWSELSVDSLGQAVQALAEREGVPDPRSIGRWPNTIDKRYPFIESISHWATGKGLSGVVWTALKPGMKGKRGTIPSLTEMKTHLAALDSNSAALAKEYFDRTPAQIMTPHRQSLARVFDDEQKGVR